MAAEQPEPEQAANTPEPDAPESGAPRRKRRVRRRRAPKQEISWSEWLNSHRYTLAFFFVAILVLMVTTLAVGYHSDVLTLSETEALMGLARYYETIERYDDAVRTWELLLEETHGAAYARVYYANALLKRGSYAEAEAQYALLVDQLQLKDGRIVKGVRIDEDGEAGVYRCVSEGGEETRYPKEEVAASIRGISPMPTFNLGLALYRQGRKQEAAVRFRLVLANYQKALPALAARARVILTRIEKEEAARKAAEQAES